MPRIDQQKPLKSSPEPFVLPMITIIDIGPSSSGLLALLAETKS